MQTNSVERAEYPLWAFAKRALIVVAIAAAAYLLWLMRYTVLMAIGAIVVAVLLLALTDLIRRFLPLEHRWALTSAVGLVVVVIAAILVLIGAQVQSQVAELWQRMPQGIEAVEQSLGIQLTTGEAAGQGQGQQGQGGPAEANQQQRGEMRTPVAQRMADWVASYGVPILDAVLGLILVIIAGVYLAAQPRLYERGAAKLLPPDEHQRALETFSVMGGALRLWLIGELIAMVIVGVLVGLGTWLIGLPAPLALGLFAGLTEFVPIIGPIVGAIPALLVALTQGGTAFLWTLLLFVAVQQIESNIIAPLVQERMVTIPPALFLLAIAAFGAVFGILGVILAAPLVVLTYVAVQKLWVREALGEPTSLPEEGG